jgi:hypothetical protein
MIYIKYIVLVPINFVITLLALITAPVMPLFAKDALGWLDNGSKFGIGPRLPKWLNWFQTPDNSLDGDATFEHLNPPSYWSKVKWLLRNPAYAFALMYIHSPYTTKCYGDPTIKDNDHAKAGYCFVKANGLFQLTWIAPIGFSRCFRITLGWNIMGLVDPNIQVKPDNWEATFVFSPRLSGFR